MILKIVSGGDPSEVLAADNEDQVKRYMQVVEKINDLRNSMKTSVTMSSNLKQNNSVQN